MMGNERPILGRQCCPTVNLRRPTQAIKPQKDMIPNIGTCLLKLHLQPLSQYKRSQTLSQEPSLLINNQYNNTLPILTI